MTDFRLTDSTLRDGSHAVGHQYTEEQVAGVVGRLAQAGVPVIEVAHGDGLGGSSFNYGFSHTDERQLLAAASRSKGDSKLAVLLLPGIGTREDLHAATDFDVEVARIATHSSEADISEQHLKAAQKLGMEPIGFLMMSHMLAPDALLEQARRMESYGATCVYVVDSAGAMTSDDVRARVSTLKENLSCEVGIHAHNNLTLAVANSMAALSEGVDQIDGCTTGLGAGGGNCPTEVLVTVCEKMGISTGVDHFAMMDTAEEIVKPLQHRPQIIDRDALTLGFAGVYGSFLLHAQRASERYDVPTRDILVELGRRGVVGGQEDMIIDVALQLQRESAQSVRPVGPGAAAASSGASR